MITLRLIYSFFIIFLAGRLILNLRPFDISGERLLIRVALYYFAGSSVIGLLMLLLSILGLRFGVLTISSPFILYLIFILARSKKTDLRYALSNILRKRSPIFVIAAFLLLLICGAMLANCAIVPIYAYDATSMWFIKAKVLFMERTIPFEKFVLPQYDFTSPEYPLLIPLNLAWMSLCLGEWNDILLRLFFALQFMLFIPFFYRSMRRYASSEVAAIGCLSLFAAPHILQYATNGYMDYAVGMFTAASIIFFLRWLDMKDARHLNLSAFFMGSAAFIKNDGIALFLVLSMTLALFLLFSTKQRENAFFHGFLSLFTFLLVGLCVFTPFQLLVRAHSIPSHIISSANVLATFLSSMNRPPIITGYFLYDIYLNTSAWHYFWIIITLLILAGFKKLLCTNMKYILAFLLLSLSMYFVVYILTAVGFPGQLESSFHRILIGLAPASAFVAFCLINDKKAESPIE